MATGARVTLAENASATGSGFSWPGGKGIFMAEATFGGGTVKLQMKSPNDTWIDVPGATFTVNRLEQIDLPPGLIRVHITTATNVYAYAVKTGQT